MKQLCGINARVPSVLYMTDRVLTRSSTDFEIPRISQRKIIIIHPSKHGDLVSSFSFETIFHNFSLSNVRISRSKRDRCYFSTNRGNDFLSAEFQFRNRDEHNGTSVALIFTKNGCRSLLIIHSLIHRSMHF